MDRWKDGFHSSCAWCDPCSLCCSCLGFGKCLCCNSTDSGIPVSVSCCIWSEPHKPAWCIATVSNWFWKYFLNLKSIFKEISGGIWACTASASVLKCRDILHRPNFGSPIFLKMSQIFGKSTRSTSVYFASPQNFGSPMKFPSGSQRRQPACPCKLWRVCKRWAQLPLDHVYVC